MAPRGLSFPIHSASLTSRLYVQAWSLAVRTVVWLEGVLGLNPSCCRVSRVTGSLEASGTPWLLSRQQTCCFSQIPSLLLLKRTTVGTSRTIQQDFVIIVPSRLPLLFLEDSIGPTLEQHCISASRTFHSCWSWKLLPFPLCTKGPSRDQDRDAGVRSLLRAGRCLDCPGPG